MCKNKLITGVMLFIVSTVIISFFGCKNFSVKQKGAAVSFASFRDIPGVTKDEIKAVEALQEQTVSFVFGALPNTEAFLDENGEIKGFTALFCEWLTGLFGIPFKPKHVTWNDLLEGLKSGEIDFAGNLTPSDERRKTYLMTDAIAHRSVKYFRIAESTPLSGIAEVRLPRYAFLAGTTTINDILFILGGKFEPVYVSEYVEAYKLMKNGEVDALIAENTNETVFDAFDDVAAYDFLPLIYSPVSLTTQNSALAPVISVMQKALENGAIDYLNELYNLGYIEYRKNKLFSIYLNDEEKAYIQNNPVIPITAEFCLYPLSFYNKNDGKWEGISLDILDEVTQITGLSFEIINGLNAGWSEMLELLSDGRAYMMPELVYTDTLKNDFIWPDYKYINDRYILASRQELREINVSEIPIFKIGLIKNTAYAEMFLKWFPQASNIIEYDTYSDSFQGLARGEVDLAMMSRGVYFSMIHYYEMFDYKINCMFDTYKSTFGINKDQTVLCSIIDKALAMIETDKITEQWESQVYGYQSKLLKVQRPWLIGMSIMSFIILVLVSVFFIRSRSTGKQLEKLVGDRTRDLEEESYKSAYQTTLIRTIIDSAPDFVFSKNSNLEYLLYNDFFAEFFGINGDELIGKSESVLPHMHNDILEQINACDEEVLRKREKVKIEIWLPYKDGSKRLFEVFDVPLIQGDGSIAGLIGIGRDITERKVIENELSFKNTLLQAVFDSIPDYIFCKDTELKHTMCNKYLLELFNVDLNSVIGKDDFNGLGMPFKEAEKAAEVERRVINECHSIVYEERVTSFSGVARMLETTKVPLIQNGAVVGMVGIAHDVTQRKKMEEEALAASRSKTSFLANMSHEMRTPMNVVVGLTDLMLEEDDPSINLKENLRKISTAGNTLLGLINDVLDISKIEAGKLELTPVEYDVPSFVNDIITINMVRIGKKPITFILDISEDMPCRLYGDDLRLKQIINNLLSNAFKYTQKGTVTLGVSCEYSGGKDLWMLIYVSDTGIGIRQEDIEKLFTDYNQVDVQANRKIEGTGLGLSITKQLTELMGGEINFASEYGKGSTFRLRIRQGFISDERIGSETSENLRSFHYADKQKHTSKKLNRADLSYASVLVVDDMQTNLDVAAGMLKKYKMRVDCVTSGEEAIDLISGGEPAYDAVFMDHMMPGMDGVEAAEKIRAIGTKYAMTIPIIALTANAIAGNEQMFIDNDFQAFLAKPINMMKLDSIVQRWVRDKSREGIRNEK